MILIADSGATKTDWIYADTAEKHTLVQTSGINPFHQSEAHIHDIICNELLPQMGEASHDISNIYFYGAGCLPETQDAVAGTLAISFPQADISINSDLLGAARALCGNNKGIACILGTGSNSCLYDGMNITNNIPPLGYILGDEGSGAYIGKHFIADCLKGHMPKHICQDFMEEYKLTKADILKRVYREPHANRFLANITPYIYKVRHIPEVHQLLTDSFTQFIRRNIFQYHSQIYVSFVGSIAWYFQEELKETAEAHGVVIGSIIKEPIHNLLKYHINQI